MNVKTMAAYQITNNRQIVDSGYAEMNYDGHKADIIGTDGENIAFMRLNNDDINRLLAMPASSAPLDERIITEYIRPSTRSQSTRSQSTKRRKSKTTHKKSLKSKHSTSRRPNSQIKSVLTRRQKIPSSIKIDTNPITTIHEVDTPIVRDTPGAHKE